MLQRLRNCDIRVLQRFRHHHYVMNAGWIIALLVLAATIIGTMPYLAVSSFPLLSSPSSPSSLAQVMHRRAHQVASSTLSKPSDSTHPSSPPHSSNNPRLLPPPTTILPSHPSACTPWPSTLQFTCSLCHPLWQSTTSLRHPQHALRPTVFSRAVSDMISRFLVTQFRCSMRTVAIIGC